MKRKPLNKMVVNKTKVAEQNGDWLNVRAKQNDGIKRESLNKMAFNEA
jgi:hypothetical protein